MDYEKEYKEAFKRAERRFDPNPTDGYAGYANGIIEDIFPQFIKREDERTRKEILDFIKHFWADHKDSIPRISNWLAWLEKQKEQKPILEVFGFKVGDAVRLKDGDGRKHIIKSFEEVEGLHGPNFYHVEFEDNSARSGIYTDEEYPNGYYTQMEKFKEEQKPSIFPTGLGEVRWNPISSVRQKPAEFTPLATQLSDYLKNDFEYFATKKWDEKKWNEVMNIQASELLRIARNELEKEQKPIKCIDFDNEFENQISHLIASILNGEHEYNEGLIKYATQSLLGYAKNEIKPDEWDKREKLFTKALQTANTRIGQLFEENQKLKEQKPAEYLDKDKVYAIMKKLHDLAFSQRIPIDSEEYKKIGEITSEVRSLLDCPIEQKPAEWSEEDRDRVAQYLHDRDGGMLWSKATEITSDILDMLRPRSSWKPSEDEERLINTSISFLKDFADKGYENAVECIDWLKSIRPVGKESLQPHWKPTEDQMKALYSALNDAISLYSNEISPSYEEISRMHFDVLESLYNDLKKL